jgi:hypothetical protein
MGAQTSYTDAPALGFEGTIDKNFPHGDLTLKNVEASASMAFGRAVCRKISGATSDMDALLPAAETDKVVGIVAKIESHARAWTSDGATYGDLDANGVRTGFLFKAITNGRMFVKAAKAVKPGDKLWVRAVAGGGEYLGALENANDSTDMIDCTKQGEWESTAAAGGLAWLRFDFLNG